MIICCNIPPRPLVEKPVKREKKQERNDSLKIYLHAPMKNVDFKNKKRWSSSWVAKSAVGT